jgi:hypothetical protein
MIDRHQKEKSARVSPKDARAARLAENLRANLKRRKEAARNQASGRDHTNSDESPERS